jgi:hypothetical protein
MLLSQGISLFSQLTYSYLDRLIFFSNPDTLLEDIPPLNPEDHCENLTPRIKSLLHRQSLGNHHIFWHLLYEFRAPPFPSYLFGALVISDTSGLEFMGLVFLQLSHVCSRLRIGNLDLMQSRLFFLFLVPLVSMDC